MQYYSVVVLYLTKNQQSEVFIIRKHKKSNFG